MGSDAPYETVFSRWNDHLRADDDLEEATDALAEAQDRQTHPMERVFGPLARVPASVYAFLALFVGIGLGISFPWLEPLGNSVKASFGYLADAAPVIIFFTLTPALVTMYKSSSAGKFAAYVVIGFTISTAAGGIFALLLSLIAFPDMTLGFGGGAAGGNGGSFTDQFGLDILVTQPFRAIYAAITVSSLLYFGGRLNHDEPGGPVRRMFRTIYEIYELVGVHGVSFLGRIIKYVMPVFLLLLGIYLVTDLVGTLEAARADANLPDAPFGPVQAYFLGVGITAGITLLWLAIVAFGICAYTRFPLRRMVRDYLLVVYPFAFATSSSAASIPLNLETARKGLGVRAQVRDFVLPLGATVNLDGTIMAAVVATILAGKMVGFTPGVLDMLLVMLPLVLISVGTPGIPNGLAVVSSTIMATLLPLPPGTEGVFAAVYLVLLTGLNDQFRTAVNTLDNGMFALLLDKWWPTRFEPGADPNPFIEPPGNLKETSGTTIGSPFAGSDLGGES